MTPEEWQDFVLNRWLKWRRKNPKTEAEEIEHKDVISRLIDAYDYRDQGGKHYLDIVDELAWEAIRDVREGRNVVC
jgi:hypothetical protein